MNVIQQLESEYIQSVKEQYPARFGGKEWSTSVNSFCIGDTVAVLTSVRVGSVPGVFKTQRFEGVVIARSNKGVSASFLVKRTILGSDVERKFMLFSPLLQSVQVIKRGKVRRAKLYYLRGRVGKKGRVKTRID
ncbi:50S ribosomal protein L19 [Rickettsiales endosymbiont of Paramecium tredecaurelia]|uniref:50S ribosomal protein L19 n=1 Tax=Candidatus Sarmatiella mevalonica TaxID=2770581 RepID=UPI001922D9D0|nr:50S ribosomal protein L19 [Candidatus Sarmatiella mevalonica]MBL3285149.1 50S ribosomal protein L19 [Candidatus Sarmatiella mevalonica]